jgi:hypothetical protein
LKYTWRYILVIQNEKQKAGESWISPITISLQQNVWFLKRPKKCIPCLNCSNTDWFESTIHICSKCIWYVQCHCARKISRRFFKNPILVSSMYVKIHSKWWIVQIFRPTPINLVQQWFPSNENPESFLLHNLSIPFAGLWYTWQISY